MTAASDVPLAYEHLGDAPEPTAVPAWLVIPAGFVLGLALTRTAKTAIVRRSVLARREAERESTLEAAYAAEGALTMGTVNDGS
jgi:hypothetical protein